MHHLPQGPTLCRLQNRVSRAAAWALHRVRTDIASFKSPPEETVLNFDATDNPLHGKQQGTFLPWLLRMRLLPATVPIELFCRAALALRSP
jgi:hypothetical protein